MLRTPIEQARNIRWIHLPIVDACGQPLVLNPGAGKPGGYLGKIVHQSLQFLDQAHGIWLPEGKIGPRDLESVVAGIRDPVNSDSGPKIRKFPATDDADNDAILSGKGRQRLADCRIKKAFRWPVFDCNQRSIEIGENKQFLGGTDLAGKTVELWG